MATQTVTIEVAPQVATILHNLQRTADAQGITLDALLLPLATMAQAMPDARKERPFYETATTEEWIKELNDWAASHDPNTPVLLDDSREAIYGDDGR
ncbi:MAG: hypothetical protein ABI977_27975 [Acidobacteriota bacterium]